MLHPFLAGRCEHSPTAFPAITTFAGAALSIIVGTIIPFGDPQFPVNRLGVSQVTVIMAGMLMVGIGVVMAAVTLGPVFGIGFREPIGRVFLNLALGVLPLFIASLGYRQVFHTGGRLLAAAYIITGAASIAMIALGSRLLLSRTRLFLKSHAVAEVGWRHALPALIMGIAVMVTELIVF